MTKAEEYREKAVARDGAASRATQLVSAALVGSCIVLVTSSLTAALAQAFC
jgi:hypothetical protein